MAPILLAAGETDQKTNAVAGHGGRRLDDAEVDSNLATVGKRWKNGRDGADSAGSLLPTDGDSSEIDQERQLFANLLASLGRRLDEEPSRELLLTGAGESAEKTRHL